MACCGHVSLKVSWCTQHGCWDCPPCVAWTEGLHCSRRHGRPNLSHPRNPQGDLISPLALVASLGPWSKTVQQIDPVIKAWAYIIPIWMIARLLSHEQVAGTFSARPCPSPDTLANRWVSKPTVTKLRFGLAKTTHPLTSSLNI